MTFLRLLCAVLAVSFLAAHAEAARLKDLAAVEGVRVNQLLGYGIVVGLDGSGDQTQQVPFTTQSLQAMLQQLGVNVPAPGNNTVQLKNVAAVMVTAQLPAFATPGQHLDITVSSMGNAKSLKGGTLLMTPLKAADGNVYAVAQGNVIVGGAGASAGGSKTQVNHLSAGRVPNGATVERAVEWPFAAGEAIRYVLHSTDFSTARRVADTINREFGPNTALAADARAIRVQAPASAHERVSFLARLESLNIETPNAAARVVINARTGSVVMNQAVVLEACAVAHGSLTVTVNSTPVISQPEAFSLGRTVVEQQADISIKEDGKGILALPAGANLADVVKALNMLGASPTDLVSILQAMQAAGSLRAELEVI